MTETTERILEAINSIPKGKVSSYRDIALRSGLSAGGARQVVRVLHSMGEARSLPWHRIIRANGAIALPAGNGKELQMEMLRAEGVEVSKEGRVDMEKYGAVFKSLRQ